MSAAGSPPPTPSATPRRSRAGARRASRSTAGQHPSHRLPSFLRAALYRRYRPARLQGVRSPRRATRSRAITSYVGGGFGPDAALGARALPRREGGRRAATRRAHAQGLSRAAAPRREETFLAFTRRHEIEALQDMFSGGRRMTAQSRPPIAEHRPGERAVHDRAAHLAQRLLRRPGFARRRRRRRRCRRRRPRR